MLRALLFPFALLYDIVTTVRNRLYDLGYKPAAEFDLPIISVGNLAVGGTGKTPMIEYLIRLLTPEYKVATLSRGYGRSTKGIRLAGDKDSALTIGDEPFQFYKNYRNKITVAVGEERALAIPHILDLHPEVQIVLLDDAFQHRKVKPSFQVLLTDFNNPFYDDMLMPAGRLRESRRGASRADAIVVTKCPPEISDEELMEIEKSIREYADKPVFFATIHYGNPISILQPMPLREKVVLVSGLANAAPFEQYARKNFNVIKHFDFPDHYVYTAEELKSISNFATSHNAVIMTTEKDATKIESDKFKAILTATPFFYLPIELEFLKNGKDFDEMIINVIQHHAS